jgi:hypothetical protein
LTPQARPNYSKLLAYARKATIVAERHGFVVEGLRTMSVISEGELHDEYLVARYH